MRRYNILLNGIGRIGKAILRISNSCEDINILAINETNDNIENLVYYINYDTTYGTFDDKYVCYQNYIKNSKQQIDIYNYDNIYQQDIKSLNIDIILDASGVAINKDLLKHCDVSAVFLTHPNKFADINIVLGINETKLNPTKHKIISTSSCNATALLPVLKLLDDNFVIKSADIVTIHPLLNHQKTLDSMCVKERQREIKCSFEFGRSSLHNIIPSKTTTIDACFLVLAKYNKTLISSSSFRVPTPTVGAINLVCFVDKATTKKELIALCQHTQSTQKHDIIQNNFEPLVSCDFKQTAYSTIIDHRFTDVKNKHMIKIVLWYDNEWGYSSKVLDTIGLFQRRDYENNSE